MSRCDDYCCNHGCHQGRDCPARVAKIGQRMPAADPLPPPIDHLKHLARWVLISIGAVLAAAFMVGVIA